MNELSSDNLKQSENIIQQVAAKVSMVLISHENLEILQMYGPPQGFLQDFTFWGGELKDFGGSSLEVGGSGWIKIKSVKIWGGSNWFLGGESPPKNGPAGNPAPNPVPQHAVLAYKYYYLR